MMNFTAKLKSQITDDWLSLFSGMTIYKPMWLARRVGPLVHGICLDRSSGSSSYFPTTYLHNLCRPFPSVSLSLGQRLLSERSGVQERILVKFHAQHYADAARRLMHSSLLPLSGNLTVDQVLSAFRAYRNLGLPDSLYPVHLFEDGIYILVWGCQLDLAKLLLDEQIREMQSWPNSVVSHIGGVEGWEGRMKNILAKPDELSVVVEAQAHALKVANLPVAELIF